LDWLPAEDACAAVTETPLASTWLDAGSTVTLTTSGATVSLSAGTGSGGTSYAATGLVEANFVQGASWDVAATGGADIAAFSLTGALHTPLAFTSIEPSIITTENTGSAYGAGFVAGGTTITWAPTGTGDFVLVELESSSYGNSIVCRSADDGTITIPGTALTGWPVGTQLLVHITRYDVSEAVLDEPSLELVARYEVVGTGSVR
jgi:hypothetical protein